MSVDLEKIKSNISVLTEAERVADVEGHLADIKEIVCPFNKNGSNPICATCSQPEATLTECKEWYLEKIPNRPMEAWSIEFNLLEVREKKKVDKQIFSTLSCDSCYLNKNCPEFKAMSTCSIDWSRDTNITDPKALIDTLIDLQSERIQIARAAELADGGIPDQNLSNEMDRLSGLISTKNEMLLDKFSIKIEGSQQNNGNGGGILSKLFGGMNKPTELPANEVIKIEEANATIVNAIDISKISEPEFEEKKLEGEPIRRGKKTKNLD